VKIKIVSAKLEAQVKRIVRSGNFREDCLGKMRPTLMRHYVGVAFEMEARERIKTRFHGPVSNDALPTLCSELFAWSAGLVSAVDIPCIEQHHFDRIVEHVVAEHNIWKTPAKTKEKTTREGPHSPSDLINARKYLHEPQAITLGQALGI
jgi:hypothetical protein